MIFRVQNLPHFDAPNAEVAGDASIICARQTAPKLCVYKVMRACHYKLWITVVSLNVGIVVRTYGAGSLDNTCTAIVPGSKKQVRIQIL